MPNLVISSVSYFSVLDEGSFFHWLRSIDGVTDVSGSGTELNVQLRSKRLTDPALRELIGLHARYDMPMRSLAAFESEKNREWFRDPSAYWFTRVFGSKSPREPGTSEQ